MENLQSMQPLLDKSITSPQKVFPLKSQQVTQWKPCINRPRSTSKLHLNITPAMAMEDGLVKRLESPAAISLLSPRPFNRQNSVPAESSMGQIMVPPLCFDASLESDTSTETLQSNQVQKFNYLEFDLIISSYKTG